MKRVCDVLGVARSAATLSARIFMSGSLGLMMRCPRNG